MSANSSAATTAFWREKRLDQLSRAEWESLCDGCGKCCLHKLQFEDTGELRYTNVGCKLLDLYRCRCTRYATRQKYVPDCVRLAPDNIAELDWMPSTCAYRLVAEGKDLYWWHPLLSGDPETVHQAGMSVRGRAIPEWRAWTYENHIVDWPA
jgi:uncharacterized cysteine cluster protein YcgN (CxxCxxCC family)